MIKFIKNLDILLLKVLKVNQNDKNYKKKTSYFLATIIFQTVYHIICVYVVLLLFQQN